ncbi:MAG: CSLREA domain-containing protein, partial [Dokdonella sp.]
MRIYFPFLSAFLLLVAAAGAHAQANDDWSNRTAISTLPFTVNEANFYQATIDPTDPDPPCRSLNGEAPSHSLWYSYTTGTSTEYLTLTVPNSHVGDPIVSVYTGVPGAFRIVSGGCSKYSDDDGLMRIAGLRLAANTSYSIEVATQFGSINSGNTLDFSVTAATQYAVTKTADTNDGACDADCSLREAIAASNANPGAVRIPAGTYSLTIAGAEEYGNATGSLDALHGMG